MGLRSFLGDHPYAAGVSTLLLLVAAAVLVAPGFFQGTFVDDQGCPWTPVEVEETGRTFSSEDELRDYVESQGKEMPEDIQFQVRDGVLYQQTGECGQVRGGDNTS